MEIIKPAAIPPVVSIENDFPGTKTFAALAMEINLIKVKPDVTQKGINTINVKMMLIKNEGVSPVSNKKTDKRNIRSKEIMGLNEKTRFIFLISLNSDLPANEAPIEEQISHEARYAPVISSYPPAIFSISLIKRN
jgi:hypothetical protein